MENLSAGAKLTDAFDRLGDQKSLHLSLGLDATPAELVALTKSSGDPMDAKTAKFISGMTFTYDMTSKKPISESGEKDITGQQLSLQGPDGALFEVRTIGTDATYTRMDMKKFGELSGEEMPSANELPPEAGAMGDMFEGRWVKFDLAKAEKLGKEMGAGEKTGGAVPGFGTPSLSPEVGKELMKDLKKAMAREVKLRDKGSKDGLVRVTASASARGLVKALVDTVLPYTKDLGLPASMPKPTAKDYRDIPARAVSVDFFLEDGAVDSASVDLGVLSKDKGDKLVLKAEFGKAEPIEAPSGATELDLASILSGMMAGLEDEGFADNTMDEAGLEELTAADGPQY
ncbi:hypothetical protein SRB5_35100 [Streptomyces sp. RB5]|uniref:Uncharacterized protein n=1 Tax=Streptomyces smaragdinus TaxID=2585196 RepID=A0A7K0CK29_9ACTN|nr:hypothetical protein [Streptomyces smaragdinus]MQY13362.1 hypothetical protein [Streptomyces smaragdinus]